MKLEHYPIEKLKKEILEIVGKHLDLKQHRVFFFGSRVDGRGNERSDIDIGIVGPNRVPFNTIHRIKEELSGLPILYKIDVVDFPSSNDDFREVASHHVELITA